MVPKVPSISRLQLVYRRNAANDRNHEFGRGVDLISNHEGLTMNQRHGISTDTLARTLGWFSIGLGLAELVAPRRLSRFVGLHGQAPVMKAYGLREVMTGLGILASQRPTGWIKGRVAGDALDLATLATGARRGNNRIGGLALAIGGVAAVTLIDMCCAAQMEREDAQPLAAMRRD